MEGSDVKVYEIRLWEACGKIYCPFVKLTKTRVKLPKRLAKVKQQTILRQSTQPIFQQLLKTTLVDFCVVWQTICRLSRPFHFFWIVTLVDLADHL